MIYVPDCLGNYSHIVFGTKQYAAIFQNDHPKSVCMGTMNHWVDRIQML